MEGVETYRKLIMGLVNQIQDIHALKLVYEILLRLQS